MVVITDEEIKECGWESQIVRIDKEVLDLVDVSKVLAEEDGDVLINGWCIDNAIDDTTDPWWEMCRNGQRRLMIVKKWYRNSVGQSWDVVMDAPISTKEELLQEMDWLKIK